MERVVAPQTRPPRRGPRSPGMVYGALAVAIVVAVGVVAFTTRQPPPPTIAEFAPQAVEQIKDAPTEQTSEFGSGEGGAGLLPGQTPSPRPGTTPKPAQAAIEVARVRRCVGEPPRQIEDPQSPPCVPYWTGDNGGRTARGVTEDTVRIYIPSPEGKKDFYEAMERFFNKRFEFYGRQLEFVWNPDEGSSGEGNPDEQAALAKDAGSKEVFGSSYHKVAQGFYYHREASRQKIVNVTGVYFGSSGGYLAENRPYMWQYLMDNDEMSEYVANWACHRLAGRNAEHSSDPAFQNRTRVFGILMQNYYDGEPSDTGPAERELARCGETSAETTKNPVRANNEQGQAIAVDPATSTTTMLAYKDAGVTSIICLCSMYTAGALMKAASTQSYFPEWLLSTYGPNDFQAAMILGSHPPEQLASAFGITVQPRQVRPQDEPWWWAIKEAAPSYAAGTDSTTVANRAEIYRPLLVLASGIQMAGPILTPETFERAMHRTAFPNPDHPIKAGAVGFTGRRYGMTRDAAEWWWSNSASSPYTPPDRGTFCYVDGGARRVKDRWPSGPDPFFEGTCDSGR